MSNRNVLNEMNLWMDRLFHFLCVLLCGMCAVCNVVFLSPSNLCVCVCVWLGFIKQRFSRFFSLSFTFVKVFFDNFINIKYKRRLTSGLSKQQNRPQQMNMNELLISFETIANIHWEIENFRWRQFCRNNVAALCALLKTLLMFS